MLKKQLGTLLLQSGFKICGYIEKAFKPYGYSGTWLISESHLAFHTFPEENKTYVELTSCNGHKQQHFVNDFPFDIVEVLGIDK